MIRLPGFPQRPAPRSGRLLACRRHIGVRRGERRGFALLAVLWVVVALAALAATGAIGARTAGAVTRNRIALARARWAAEGCLAVQLARLDSLARAERPLEAAPGDTLRFADGASCVSVATDPSAQPDNDTGRVNLNAAPPEALARLPGFTDEALRVVMDRRRWGDRFSDLFQLLGRLSPAARAEMLARYGALLRRVTFAPERLLVTATGRADLSRAEATIELVVVPAGPRAAVVRRRMW
jgi:type II secretory pathway component PulK